MASFSWLAVMKRIQSCQTASFKLSVIGCGTLSCPAALGLKKKKGEKKDMNSFCLLDGLQTSAGRRFFSSSCYSFDLGRAINSAQVKGPW